MTIDVSRTSALLATAITTLACRPDAGTPDYSSHVGVRDSRSASEDILPGPNPYVPGEARLYVGAFYEGDRSDEVTINDVDTHYFIFQIEGTMELTYSQDTSAERVEGKRSDALRLTGTPWWGGGIIWDTPRDLSDWTTMYISLRSTAESLDDFNLAMRYDNDGERQEVILRAADYGYVNDDNWHNLQIPLSDFAGLDTSRILSPLTLGQDGGTSGEVLFVDDLYFTQD